MIDGAAMGGWKVKAVTEDQKCEMVETAGFNMKFYHVFEVEIEKSGW